MCNEYGPGFTISIWYANNPRNCASSAERETKYEGLIVWVKVCPYHAQNITVVMVRGQCMRVM
jgi:hypothetical protein